MNGERLVNSGLECILCNQKIEIVCSNEKLSGIVAIAVKAQDVLFYLNETNQILLCFKCNQKEIKL